MPLKSQEEPIQPGIIVSVIEDVKIFSFTDLEILPHTGFCFCFVSRITFLQESYFFGGAIR